MSAAPATGAMPVATPLLAMLGSADAAACEGDACLVPGATADASPAADLARVRDAIDAGRAI
ncbi:hypothetical protein [Clavibacter michiganensis]|uniref:hypothetical protein n=1 Tax=Clavibacter michiganensis TaxID=28447 RepID=UPI003EBE7199